MQGCARRRGEWLLTSDTRRIQEWSFLQKYARLRAYEQRLTGWENGLVVFMRSIERGHGILAYEVVA